MSKFEKLVDKKKLEIFCDASMRKFPNGRSFGCAGALTVLDNQPYGMPYLKVLPDSTNNESEAMAVYLAVEAAYAMTQLFGEFEEIVVYSDSRLSVFGLKVWMENWISMMHNNVLYTKQGVAVSNQNIFKMIYDFLARNDIKIRLLHCKGHVNVLSRKHIITAANVFYESNGFYPSEAEIIRLANFNNYIDVATRDNLKFVDSNMNKLELPKQNYLIPVNWREYIS